MPEAAVVSIEIAASPEVVFDAITQSQAVRTWFAEATDIDLSARRYDFWGRHTIGNPDREEGRHDIVTCVPGSELSYIMKLGGDEAIVKMTLERTKHGTMFTTRFVCSEEQIPLARALLDLSCLALQNLRSFVEERVVAWRPDFATPRTGELRISVDANVDAATAFAAFIEPDQLDRWMAGNHSVVEPHVGGRYDLGWPDQAGRPLVILELAPETKLTYSWTGDDAEGTQVTWELEGSDGATRITLIHSGFTDDGAVEGYYRGWADFLVRLKWMLEKGTDWAGPRWEDQGQAMTDAS